MYKFVTLFALVGSALAAPAPEPGYYAAAPVVHAPVVAATPVHAVHAAPLVAQPTLYHSAHVVAAPVATQQVVTYHAPATSHQQVTKIDKSSSIISHYPQYTSYHAPALAYVH